MGKKKKMALREWADSDLMNKWADASRKIHGLDVKDPDYLKDWMSMPDEEKMKILTTTVGVSEITELSYDKEGIIERADEIEKADVFTIVAGSIEDLTFTQIKVLEWLNKQNRILPIIRITNDKDFEGSFKLFKAGVSTDMDLIDLDVLGVTDRPTSIELEEIYNCIENIREDKKWN